MNKFLDKLIRYFRVKKIISNIPKNVFKILDIGCGPKPWFFYLRTKNLENIDITAIDKIEYNFISNIPFKFIVYDVENPLPFDENSFDLVTALALIEHLNNRENFLKEIYRILKPEGILLMTTPSRLAKPILEFLAFKLHLIDEKEITDHKYYFNKKEFKNILEKIGFKNIKV